MSVGQPIERVDGRLKVTGRATYTADQNIPNLAFGVLVASAIAKGRIASIDTAAAERVPGTLAVLTHKSGLKLAKDPSQVDPGSPADRSLQLLQDDRDLLWQSAHRHRGGKNAGGGVRGGRPGGGALCGRESLGHFRQQHADGLCSEENGRRRRSSYQQTG